GQGHVLFLAADPTAEPLNTWSGNGALWKYIMAYNDTPIAVYPFFNAFGGFNTIQNWGIPPRGAIYDISSVDPPSQRWLWVFMGLYALIAGPLNYLLLRFSGRLELAWLTIPLCVAVGAVVSFQFAQRYRGADVILNKISIVRADGNSVLANVRSYVALYTPRKADFHVSVPGVAATTSYAPPAIPQATARDREGLRPWTLKVAEGETSNLVEMPLNEANTGTFFSDGQVRLAGRFDSSLKVDGRSIAGKLTNHTGQSVDGVLLALGQDVVKLGPMRNGQTKDVRFTFDPSAPSTSPNPAAVKAALSDGKAAQGELTDKLSIIDAFLGSNSSAQPAGLSGLTLMGWLEKSPLPLQIAGLHPNVRETNLYVSSVPLHFPRGLQVLIPSALIESKQIGSFSTTFQRTGQYELNPSGSLAVEFNLPISYSAMISHRLVLHMVGHYSGGRNISSDAAGATLGQIFVYNWQSSNWDAQDLAWGDNVIQQSEQHLSATATVRVRFTYKAPAAQPTASIQFSLDLTDQGNTR
ncbi:MAG: hypothetical protein KGJ86_05345, partial [Chloroflexota bacterium]|nr:hypothetical protein [Chloroflexota bacterium]